MRSKTTIVLCIAAALVLGSFLGYAICEAAKECGNDQKAASCAALSVAGQVMDWFTRDRIDTISTAFIAAFTVLLWISTKGLWKEATSAGNTAKVSADAASKAAQVAEDTLVSTNRPWVLITGVKQRGLNGDGSDTIGTGYGLDVSIKNVGNSPATCIFVNALAIDGIVPSDADLPNIVDRLRRDNESPGITLVPGDSGVVDTYCISHEKDARDHKNLGLVICCVFYSFPFKAGTTDGCCYGIYRATRKSVIGGDLWIVLDKLSVHVE